MQLVAPVRESIVEHAQQTTPEEACGLLGGTVEAPQTVRESISTPNIAAEPTHRFEIDPEALLAGRDRLRSAGRELVGFYHSHPKGPSEPSETDRHAANWPGTYTIIVSLEDRKPTLSAWKDTGSSFQREPIELLASDST